MKSQKGFTLLELLIAVTILAFISIFTSKMIQQGLQAKSKIQAEIDRTSQLTAALQLISHDIEMSFHYRDFNVELYNAAQKERQSKDSAAKPPPKPGDPPVVPDPAADAALAEKYKQKEDKPFSRFLGEGDKLNFTTLNNFRAAKNLQQSDQAEVGYFLDTCTSRKKKEESSQCLWRRSSPYVDEDVKEGGNKTVLVENVKNLKFRYLGFGEKVEWVETWMSEKGDETQKGKFPSAVEVTLTLYDKRFTPPKEIAMTIVAPLRFPNNKPDEKSGVVN